MSIIQAMTTSFKVDILSGGHNFNTSNRALTINTQDVFYMALYLVANGANLDATTTGYTTSGEVIGIGYIAGGQPLVVSQIPTSVGIPTTTAFINFNDASWIGASFSADGALIYNFTNANRSVAVLSFGSTKTVSNGTFTVQFPAAGTGAAIVQIQ